MRKIEIELNGQWVENPVSYLPGVISEAILLDEEAPETCQALWDSLPIHTRTIHTFAAGQCWRTESNHELRQKDAPIENMVQEISPGDILYHDSRGMGNYKIAFCYGNAKWPLPASHIARIDKNLEGLVNMSRRILYEGPITVTIRRKE